MDVSEDRLLLVLSAKEMCVRTGIRSDWMPLGENGSGPVDVRVMERAASKAYWLIVQTPKEDEVADMKELLRCKITNTLDYSVANSTFHYFGDSSTEYGLRFRSADDALDFSSKIIGIKSTLLKASRKRKKRNERIIRQEQFNRIEKIVEEEPEPALDSATATAAASATLTESPEQLATRLSVKERERERQREGDQDSVGSGGHGHTPTTPPAARLAMRLAAESARPAMLLDEPSYVAPYVQFYPNEPVATAETEAALLQAKKGAAAKQPPVASRPGGAGGGGGDPGALPHPYAKIDGDEDDEDDEDDGTSPSPGGDDAGDNSRRTGAPVTVTRETVVSVQPQRSSVGLCSRDSSTDVPRGASHGQAPATTHTSHRKLARQTVPIEVHQSIQQQVDEHKVWITKQEQQLQFYEKKNEIRRREDRLQQERDNLQSNHRQLPTATLPASQRRAESTLAVPVAETNGRRLSNLSQIGALVSEAEKRQRARQDSLEKPPVTQQPPLSALGTSTAARQRLECCHCGQFYYADENRTGDCEDGPSTCKSCVDLVSCLELASCITYWCASDEENEYVFPFQCSPNSDEDRVCCRRWTILCAAGLCCPCLFCYWPLRTCMDIGRGMHVCGSAHEHTTKTGL